MSKLIHKGQQYELTETVKDYVNGKGLARPLRLVRTRCADCGEPFEFWVTDEKIDPKRFNRRCAEHRKELKRVAMVHPLARAKA